MFKYNVGEQVIIVRDIGSSDYNEDKYLAGSVGYITSRFDHNGRPTYTFSSQKAKGLFDPVCYEYCIIRYTPGYNNELWQSTKDKTYDSLFARLSRKPTEWELAATVRSKLGYE